MSGPGSKETRPAPAVAAAESDQHALVRPGNPAPSVGRCGLGAYLRALSPTWLALGLYLLLSLLFFGRQVVGHLGSAVIAPNDIDPSQYQWFLAWWPHAILHGLNPFITHQVYVPQGYNLTWTTSMAGPALVLAPLTIAFGSTVSFNVFSLLAPTLSAWSAFLLCRHITRRTWPSLFGGFAFGFSGYMLTTTQGDPWLAFVALLPAFVLLILKWLDGSLSSRPFVGLMALGIAFQFLTSVELLATATLLAGFALLAALILLDDRRAALLGLVLRLVLAGAVAAVVLSPFLIFMFSPHPVPNQALLLAKAPTDPISFWVPGPLQARGAWQAAQWARIGISGVTNTFAFLGVPALLIVAAFARERRRERTVWLLVICFLASALAVMGVRLVVAGHDTGLPLPWALIRKLPFFQYALPVRLGVFPALIAAVVLAMWLADARWGSLRWVGGALAAAALIPSLSAPVWHSATVDPPFFSTGEYHKYLSRSDNVVTIPVDGPNERWQARTGFAFNIVGGYLGAFPSSYTRFAAWNALLNGKRSADWPRALRTYLAAKHATVILIDKRLGPRWPQLFTPLGLTPVDTGGVLFYRLAPPL